MRIIHLVRHEPRKIVSGRAADREAALHRASDHLRELAVAACDVAPDARMPVLACRMALRAAEEPASLLEHWLLPEICLAHVERLCTCVDCAAFLVWTRPDDVGVALQEVVYAVETSARTRRDDVDESVLLPDCITVPRPESRGVIRKLVEVLHANPELCVRLRLGQNRNILLQFLRRIPLRSGVAGLDLHGKCGKRSHSRHRTQYRFLHLYVFLLPLFLKRLVQWPIASVFILLKRSSRCSC